MRLLGLLAAALVLTLAVPAEAKGRRHRTHAAKSHHQAPAHGAKHAHSPAHGHASPAAGKAGSTPRDGQAR